MAVDRSNITKDISFRNFIYYTVYLEQTLRDPGFLTSVESAVQTQPIAANSSSPVFTPVQGSTTSRLDEVRTYNKAQPYVIGVNGVTEVSAQEISYVIDGIVFTTQLLSGETTFAFGVAGLTNANSESYAVVKDERDEYTSKTPTQNNIFIERNEMSVFNNIYKLSRVDSLDDFNLYF